MSLYASLLLYALNVALISNQAGFALKYINVFFTPSFGLFLVTPKNRLLLSFLESGIPTTRSVADSYSSPTP